MANEKTAGLLRGIAGAAVAGVAGWLGYSALAVDHNLPLPPAVDADRKLFISPEAGLLSYYADTDAPGRPLVLIHSINAAASSYEMRPIFNHFRGTRPVYALDLPGFGFSERSVRPYSPHLYAQAIADFLTTQVRGGADVIALSLGSEFAARVALEQPEYFNTLTLISPSGFTPRRELGSSQRARSSGGSEPLYNVFAFPLWAQGFYDLLATRPSINYFLSQSFVGPVDPGLMEYAYLTAHQPGARHAPLYFVSGRLFTPDVRETIYEQLRLPVLVLHDRDPYVRFDNLEVTLRSHANWYSSRIAPTLGLPQFERMPDVAAALENFWAAQDPLQPYEPSAAPGWSGKDVR